jgi:hypothetical protein
MKLYKILVKPVLVTYIYGMTQAKEEKKPTGLRTCPALDGRLKNKYCKV